MKKLIIYYSLTESCKIISDILAKEIEADILRIKPKKDVSPKGFMTYIKGGRQVLLKEKPEIESYEFLAEKYDLLIIGTPVWTGNYVPAIRTFFSENKIENKKIALFCCHRGGMGKTLENMEKELSDNEIIVRTDFYFKKNKIEENIKKAKEFAKNILNIFQ